MVSLLEYLLYSHSSFIALRQTDQLFNRKGWLKLQLLGPKRINLPLFLSVFLSCTVSQHITLMPPTVADEFLVSDVYTGGFEVLPTNIDMQFDTLSQLDRSLKYRYPCSTIELCYRLQQILPPAHFGGL